MDLWLSFLHSLYSDTLNTLLHSITLNSNSNRKWHVHVAIKTTQYAYSQITKVNVYTLTSMQSQRALRHLYTLLSCSSGSVQVNNK